MINKTSKGKIVLISDLAAQVADSNVSLTAVLQQLVLAKIAEFGGLAFSINEMSSVDLGELFKKKFPELEDVEHKTQRLKWNEIEFPLFDYIIIDHSLIDDFLKFINNNYLASIANSLLARIYLLEGNSVPKDSAFQKIGRLIKSGFFGDESSLKTLVEPLKKKTRECFIGLTEDFYERRYGALMQGIGKGKTLKSRNRVKKILLLDDYTFNFFIGDLCLWMADIKRRVLQNFPNAVVNLNCKNQLVFQKLSDLFGLSSPGGICITNKNWNELDFNAYDLIICQHDRVLKLLHHLQNVFGGSLPPSPICYFTPIYYRDSLTSLFKRNDYWSYENVLSFSQAELDKATSLRYLLANKDKEIDIPESERAWGNGWLEDNGVAGEERVVVLPYSASTEIKLLKPDEYIRLVQWFLLNRGVKVLIFKDTMFEKIQQHFFEVINESKKSIIVAPMVDLRTTARILSSKYIAGVVGPCTGVLHMANGIFTFLRNKQLSKHPPFLLVYTGNFTDFEEHYHPLRWWLHTIAKVVVAWRGLNGETILVPMQKCSRSRELYGQYAMPVSMIKAQQLIDQLLTKFEIKRYFPSPFKTLANSQQTG